MQSATMHKETAQADASLYLACESGFGMCLLQTCWLASTIVLDEQCCLFLKSVWHVHSTPGRAGINSLYLVVSSPTLITVEVEGCSALLVGDPFVKTLSSARSLSKLSMSAGAWRHCFGRRSNRRSWPACDSQALGRKAKGLRSFLS